MTPEEFARLRISLNLSPQACAKVMMLDDAQVIDEIETGKRAVPPALWRRLAELDSQIEDLVLDAVDAYDASDDGEVLLIRFLEDQDLALYEPEQFEKLRTADIHSALIGRIQSAIEILGGQVLVAYMDSEFYETWLGINDFDDGPTVRETWARQQVRSAPSEE